MDLFNHYGSNPPTKEAFEQIIEGIETSVALIEFAQDWYSYIYKLDSKRGHSVMPPSKLMKAPFEMLATRNMMAALTVLVESYSCIDKLAEAGVVRLLVEQKQQPTSYNIPNSILPNGSGTLLTDAENRKSVSSGQRSKILSSIQQHPFAKKLYNTLLADKKGGWLEFENYWWELITIEAKYPAIAEKIETHADFAKIEDLRFVHRLYRILTECKWGNRDLFFLSKIKGFRERSKITLLVVSALLDEIFMSASAPSGETIDKILTSKVDEEGFYLQNLVESALEVLVVGTESRPDVDIDNKNNTIRINTPALKPYEADIRKYAASQRWGYTDDEYYNILYFIVNNYSSILNI